MDTQKQDIKVSVCCITYNQEDYIEDAIKSFLMQKTDFNFEILIHDDASTDGTAEIVRRYVEKYPNKIKAILQTKNQYSQGVNIVEKLLFPLVQGKYVAYCEGDDFWTDPYKLQKQYDYMEKNPDCSLYLHEGYLASEDKRMQFNLKPQFSNARKLDIEDAIRGIGSLVATNSFFERFEGGFGDELPEFAKVAPVGDYIVPILSSFLGYIYYDPEKMSAYRIRAKNSFTSSMATGPESIQRWEAFVQRFEHMLKLLDEYTEYKHTEVIRQYNLEHKFNYYVLSENWDRLKQEPYKSMLKTLPPKKKLQLYCPKLFKVLQSANRLMLTVKYKIKPTEYMK